MIPVLQKPSASADSPLILATGAEEQTATIAKLKRWSVVTLDYSISDVFLLHVFCYGMMEGD